MGKITRKEVEKIKKKSEEDFPNDPALQQVHAARKILAREAELAGLSYLEYIKKIRKTG